MTEPEPARARAGCDRLGDEIVLQPLDESAVGELVASPQAARPTWEALASIAVLSDGNPFAVEDVWDALEEGHPQT